MNLTPLGTRHTASDRFFLGRQHHLKKIALKRRWLSICHVRSRDVRDIALHLCTRVDENKFTGLRRPLAWLQMQHRRIWTGAHNGSVTSPVTTTAEKFRLEFDLKSTLGNTRAQQRLDLG